MKKSLFTVLTCFFLLLVLLVVTGCSSQEPNKEEIGKVGDISGAASTTGPAQKASPYLWQTPLPPDIARIIARGQLIVAMYNGDRPPWFYTDQDGRLKGFDVEMAYDIARLLGVNVKFDRAAQNFNEVVDRVAAGHADIAISKLSVTLTRAQRIRFTQPYIVFHQSILVNRLQLADLLKKNPGKPPLELVLNTSRKIGVPQGTSYEEFVGSVFPNAEIVPIPGRQEIMVAANNGEVLAALYDEQEIRTFMNEHPDYSLNLKVYVLDDRTDPIAIAVSPRDEQLLAWLNTYLDFAKRDRAYEEILLKEAGGAK